MSVEANDCAPRQRRWRWVVLALLPGFISDAMFGGWVLSNEARSDAVVAFGTGLLYAAGLLPFGVPFYLLGLGREYVRQVHGGYQSVAPFVIMYGVGNFILWVGGVLLVLSAIGYR